MQKKKIKKIISDGKSLVHIFNFINFNIFFYEMRDNIKISLSSFVELICSQDHKKSKRKPT